MRAGSYAPVVATKTGRVAEYQVVRPSRSGLNIASPWRDTTRCFHVAQTQSVDELRRSADDKHISICSVTVAASGMPCPGCP
jgi:hypothetical protein